MCKYAPFLQMYTVYVEKFESAMKTIDVYRTKSPRFAALLQDLQVSITAAADAAVFVYNSLFTKDMRSLKEELRKLRSCLFCFAGIARKRKVNDTASYVGSNSESSTLRTPAQG